MPLLIRALGQINCCSCSKKFLHGAGNISLQSCSNACMLSRGMIMHSCPRLSSRREKSHKLYGFIKNPNHECPVPASTRALVQPAMLLCSPRSADNSAGKTDVLSLKTKRLDRLSKRDRYQTLPVE